MPTTTPQIHERNLSLDYLRGLAATSIMAYHLSLFSFGESNASTLTARIKIYAISIFYVLSGLTLFIANTKLLVPEKNSVTNFYIKRFFRIFPLLWLATLGTYLLTYNPLMYSVKHLIVNITILPGMLRPDAFEANGAWTIGNELFFYLCFPILFFLYQQRQRNFFLVLVALFAVFCLFTFIWLDPTINLGYQWSKYVNPFNQFFYFAMGVCLATLKKPALWLVNLAPWLIVLCMLAVVLYPQSGEPIVLVTGITRPILSFFVIAMCYFFYISNLGFLPGFVKKCLQYLSNASYAIYLLHPLVYLVVNGLNQAYGHLNVYFVIIATTLITLLLSGAVYQTFERYFMGIGKNIIAKRTIATNKTNTL